MIKCLCFVGLYTECECPLDSKLRKNWTKKNSPNFSKKNKREEIVFVCTLTYTLHRTPTHTRTHSLTIDISFLMCINVFLSFVHYFPFSVGVLLRFALLCSKRPTTFGYKDVSTLCDGIGMEKRSKPIWQPKDSWEKTLLVCVVVVAYDVVLILLDRRIADFFSGICIPTICVS